MCKYSDYTGYKCQHENLEDNDYCIFHLQDDDKDVEEFNKGIKEILETEEDFIKFNGFYFPPISFNFSDIHFQKNVVFFNVTFSGGADFVGAKFSGNTYFWDAKFSEKTNFFHAKFSEKTEFTNAIFSKKTNFTGATFSETDFEGATFSERTDFAVAKFSGDAYFMDAKFSGIASFGFAKFSELASFGGAEFLKYATFEKARFSGYADFEGATFSGGANFEGAIFSEKTNFMSATFSGYADFEGATFSEKTNFMSATFSADTYFKNAEFSGIFVFIPSKSETIIFEFAFFSDNVRIKADMSKSSFANSNIERVDMTDSSWIRDEDKPKKSVLAFYKRIRNKVGISKPSIIIWEDYQGELSSNWKELEGIYRRLKQSYQKFGNNSIAGKFYYQEMECKKKQLKGIEKLFWDVFYKKLCGYGEKPFNVIFASIFLVFVSAFLFLFGGIEFVGSSVLNVQPNVIDYNLSLNSFGIQYAITNIDSVLEDFILCIYTSVVTFTTLGYGDVHPIGFSRIVASVEAGLGIIMTALFIFVFTRKMLR